jgi:hypothetical protein
MEPAVRLVRLRNDRAIGAPTSPINLSHSADELEIGIDQLARSLAVGVSDALCRVPLDHSRQAAPGLLDPPNVGDGGGRVYRQSMLLELELFGRALPSPEALEWPDLEPELLSERAVYEQAPLSQLDYHSTEAPSRPDLASRELRLDTDFEDMPIQTLARARGPTARGSLRPHLKQILEQRASIGFFYIVLTNRPSGSWYYNYKNLIAGFNYM